ncbi:hypothetical protein HHK36_032617 [Tetracentron sinense]|uniref:Uncharacterized protein n=1 Tax=Tetracentron sinense TaxID=13715 RepID=A0A834Y579_TETSI|nr:hypothetical protein HHK36_032617 [Tetracentron sinense]
MSGLNLRDTGMMGMFEEMGFCGNLDFLAAPPREGDVALDTEPEATVEEDYTDDEMDVMSLRGGCGGTGCS